MARRKKSGATNPRTVVGIVQDKSGSMAIRRDATISGYNEYLETLKQEDRDSEVLLTLTQFDTRVVDVYVSKPLDDVVPLSFATYVPSGMTALYDAIGETVRSMEETVQKDDKVLIVIMTDGLENSSREWDFTQIINLFKDKRENGWEFIFLGAGEDSWATGKRLGFDDSHRIFYSENAHDHEVAFKAASASTASILQGSSSRDAISYLATSPEKASLEQKAADQRVSTLPARPRRAKKQLPEKK